MFMLVINGLSTSSLSHEQPALSKTLFNLLTPHAEGVGGEGGIHKAKGVFSLNSLKPSSRAFSPNFLFRGNFFYRHGNLLY